VLLGTELETVATTISTIHKIAAFIKKGGFNRSAVGIVAVFEGGITARATNWQQIRIKDK